MGRKLGAVPFWEGKLDLHLANVAWTEAYLHAKCYLDPYSRFATIDMGRKLGWRALSPFWGGELGPHLTAGSPSNPVSLGQRPASLPSFILIDSAIWPQEI